MNSVNVDCPRLFRFEDPKTVGALAASQLAIIASSVNWVKNNQPNPGHRPAGGNAPPYWRSGDSRSSCAAVPVC